MGILGLTSFVDHRCKAFLQQEHINNCHLVIDGDNVAHHIFKRKPRSTGYGADYASYATEVESFFLDLKSCEISPVVLLDGGRDAAGAKLPKQLCRLTEKVQRAARVATVKHLREDVFPPLARTVFVQVARRLSVPVAQCRREADGCAAALARRLCCAVLSDDSDFCALGVPVVRLTPWQRPCTAPNSAPFMNCIVFRPEKLLKHYGVSPEHLPLLATLPGNDMVPSAVLDPFFRRLYVAHGTGRAGARERPGQRIKALLRWLATQNSPQQALDKVLSMLPEKDRAVVAAHAELVATSIADESLEFLAAALPQLYQTLCERALAAGDAPLPAPAAGDGGGLPVADAVLPACVLDAAAGAPALLEPAVELLTEPAAALAAAPLLARLARLLSDRALPVTLYVRDGRQVGERTAAAADLPPLPGTPRGETLLSQLLGVRCEDAPPPLRLLVAALVVWRRAVGGRGGRRAVRAALLTCAALAPEDALPVSAESITDWRERTAPLRERPAGGAADPAAVHLLYQLQYILLMAGAANEALGRPLHVLDADRTIHGPLALALGFNAHTDADAEDVAASDGAPRPDEELEEFVTRLTEMIVASAEEGDSAAPAGTTPGGTGAAVTDAEPGSAERLSRLMAVAGVPPTGRGHKRRRPPPLRTNSKKRSRR